MATDVNVKLKVTGDARDGVQAFDQTTQAARRTAAEVDKTQRSIQNMLRGIPIGTAISAIGNIQSAFSQLGEIVDFVTGGPGRRAAAQEAVNTATNAAALGAGYAAQAREAALRPSFRRFWENLTPGTP